MKNAKEKYRPVAWNFIHNHSDLCPGIYNKRYLETEERDVLSQVYYAIAGSNLCNKQENANRWF